MEPKQSPKPHFSVAEEEQRCLRNEHTYRSLVGKLEEGRSANTLSCHMPRVAACEQKVAWCCWHTGYVTRQADLRFLLFGTDC